MWVGLNWLIIGASSDFYEPDDGKNGREFLYHLNNCQLLMKSVS
jgi:hypothetical protein